MKPSIIITLLLLFFSIPSYSCDCVYGGPFTKMAKKSPLVVQVKIKKFRAFKNINDSRMPTAMEAEVVSIYKGREKRKTIVVWGDDGQLCRPYLDTFKKGHHYVMALKSCKDAKGQQQEKDSDYFIDACGCYWLTVDIKKQLASGDVDGKKRTLKLKDLKKSLQG